MSGPLVVAQIGVVLMGAVDMWMVGRLGKEALAAVALGSHWVMGTHIIALGVILGVDPIISQAHGRADVAACGRALQRGLILAVVTAVPLMLSWWFAGPAIAAFGQHPPTAELAGAYCRAQVFSGVPFLLFTALRQSLQARGLMRPTLFVVVIANVVNVAFDEVLIFGRLGLPALGVDGAGIATGMTRCFMLVMLFAIVVIGGLHRGGWVPWSRAALAPRGYVDILRYGLPTGIMIGLESWAFCITTFLAGLLGDEELASHGIVLKMAALSFMVPLGISMATVARVGNLIGAGDRPGAQRAAWVALAMGGGCMLVFALAFTILRAGIPALFAREADVIALAAAVFPVVATFQFFDGVQVVGGAVLRAMGRPVPAAIFNLVGYYACAIPLGAWLAFGAGMGLVGLWSGLAVGLALVATALVVWIWRRGPAVDTHSA